MDFVRVRINANTVLAKIGSATAQVVAAIGTAVLATGVGAYSSFYRGDAATPLVFAWALYAIYKDGGYRAPLPSDSTSSSSGDKKDKKNKDGDEKKGGEVFQQNGGMYTVREANEAVYRHRAHVRNCQSTFRR